MARHNFLNKTEADINFGQAILSPAEKEPNEVKKLLLENLHYSQAIYADVKKIKRYMFWRLIISAIWIILIILPLIVAVIWLPPILSDFMSQSQNLLGGGNIDLTGTLQLLDKLNSVK